MVVEPERVVGVLNWVTREMDRRYKLFARVGRAQPRRPTTNGRRRMGEATLPYIVVFIDELADLMMVAPDEVERSICRIAQMARATGIHLVIATQRPSVDVVTGLIKANFPARIAFAVTSQIDSRVILDTPGRRKAAGPRRHAVHGARLAQAGAHPGLLCLGRRAERAGQFWKARR